MPVEYDSIIPPAGCTRIAGGQAVLDLSDVLLSTVDAALSGDATISGDLLVSGTMTLEEAPVLPATDLLVKRYVSQLVGPADLTVGSASCTVSLTDFPTDAVALGAYLVTTATATSSNGLTTGLTAKLGIASVDDDAYVTSISVFGAAGRKLGPPGASIGGFVSGVPQLTFTATGGTPAIAHINALALYAVIYYVVPTTEA